MNVIRNSQGFSLVELMVVVAIIGVLAAMSAGQVQKQIAKARQSEAKTALGTLWTSATAFQAEYAAFTSDFTAMKLSYTGRIRYHVGFSANHLAPPAGYPGVANANAYNTAQTPARTCTGCVVMAGATAPTGTNMTATTFNARAAGQPVVGTADVWNMSHTKVLTNPTDGIQ